MARRNIKGITIKLGGDASGITKAISEAESASYKLSAELKDVERLLKLDPKNTELLRQKQEMLANATEETKKKLEALKQANEKALQTAGNYDAWKEKFDPIQTEIDETREKLNKLKEQQSKMDESGEINTGKYDALKSEIEQTENKLKGLRKEAKNVSAEFGNPISPEQYNTLQREIIATEQELKKLGESSQITTGKMEGICGAVNSVAIMEAADNLSGVGDTLKDIGQNAMESAFNMSDAQNKIASNLNLTAKETEAYGKIAQEVFEKGIVEDADAAADAIILIKQQMGELNQTDLKNLTNGIIAISKRTETDFQENITGASKLMNAFGLSGQQAMDIIAAGYQNGLNTSDDFMDTITEYTPLFKDAGFSADEMFQIMKNGLENGAMNTDKVADAVKELQVRLGDGTFEKNIGNFSDNTKKTFDAWKNGKATVKDVAMSVGKDLEKMTPNEQQEALSALSTQFEDLGLDASAALFGVGNAFDDVEGKAKKMTKQTPAEKWEGSLRKLQDSLIPIGTQIVSAMQPIVDIVAKIAEAFSHLPGPVQTLIVAIGGLITLFITLAPAISAIMTIFGSLSLTALAPFAPIILGIIAAIAALISIIKNWGTIVETLKGIWDAFSQTLITIVTGIVSSVVSSFQSLGVFISSIFSTIRNTISTIFNGIKMNISQAVSVIGNVIRSGFTAVKTFISSILSAVRSVVTNAFSTIKTAISTACTAIKSVVTKVFGAIRSFIVSVVITIKSKAVAGFRAMKSGISAVVSTLVAVVKRPFNQIRGFILGLASQAYGWGKDFINGLKRGIESGISAIVSKVKGLAAKIRSFLHFSRPDEGPLRDYETWMPDFMEGLAKGITSNMGMIKKAMSQVATAMQLDVSGISGNENVSWKELSQIINLLSQMLDNLKREKGIWIDRRELGRIIREEV